MLGPVLAAQRCSGDDLVGWSLKLLLLQCKLKSLNLLKHSVKCITAGTYMLEGQCISLQKGRHPNMPARHVMNDSLQLWLSGGGKKPRGAPHQARRWTSHSIA